MPQTGPDRPIRRDGAAADIDLLGLTVQPVDQDAAVAAGARSPSSVG